MVRLLALSLILALSACGSEQENPTPEAVTRSYWAAVQNDDSTTADALTTPSSATTSQDENETGSMTRSETTVDGSKLLEIKIGETVISTAGAQVDTTLTSQMGDADSDDPQLIEVSFNTELLETSSGWLIDREATDRNMMAAAMQAAFGVMKQALTEGMQEAMKGLGDAMAEGMQAVTEGLSDELKKLQAHGDQPATAYTEYQAPQITPARVTGLIKQTPVELRNAEWSNTLALYSGESWGSNPSLLLFLFLPEGQQPVARTITVEAAATGGNTPHIHYRWRNPDSGEINSTILTQGYNLTLTFGDANNARVPGQISFSVPGETTELRGSFEIQLPPQ